MSERKTAATPHYKRVKHGDGTPSIRVYKDTPETVAMILRNGIHMMVVHLPYIEARELATHLDVEASLLIK